MIELGKGSAYRAHPTKKDEAKDHLNNSLDAHLRLRAKLHEAMTYSELGRLSMEFHDYSSSERQLIKAKEIFSELNNPYYYVAQLCNLAELDFRRCNYPQARAFAVEAINQAIKNGFPIHQVRAQLMLGEINLTEPDDQLPMDLYVSAIRTATTLKNPYFINEILARIANQSHILNDEEDVYSSIIQLCSNVTEEKWIESLKGGYSTTPLKEWRREIEKLQSSLQSEHSLSFHTGHALIIGINNYLNDLNKLSKAAVDANDLYGLLSQNGYPTSNMTLLLDEQATKRAIDNALNKFASHIDSQDTVVIFFSGHGAQNPGGFTPGEYICPVDARKDDLNSTAISSVNLTTAIKAIKAKQVVVLLDACHSGGVGEIRGAGEIKSGLSSEAYDKLATGEGRVVIASCRPDEVSYELREMRNGLFTYYLLEGLRGEAASSDGSVRIFSLFEYLSRWVPRRKPQNPIIKMTATQNFPIIPRFNSK